MSDRGIHTGSPMRRDARARLLAGAAALLFLVALGVLALVLWHRAIAGAGPTWVIAPSWLPVGFVAGSVVVGAGALAALGDADGNKGRSTRILARAALLLTAAAWMLAAAAWLAMA